MSGNGKLIIAFMWRDGVRVRTESAQPVSEGHAPDSTTLTKYIRRPSSTHPVDVCLLSYTHKTMNNQHTN